MTTFLTKSLARKLFILITAMVLAAVTGNSVQFFLKFKAQVLSQLQDSLQTQAVQAKDQIEALLNTWLQQLSVTVPTLVEHSSQDGKTDYSSLEKFVTSNRDFVSLILLSAPTPTSSDFSWIGDRFTSNVGDRNFEDKDARVINEQIKEAVPAWLKTQALSTKGRFAFHSLAKATKLPLVTLAVRFSVPGTDNVIWVALTAWQTGITKALVKSSYLKSNLVDVQGRIFSSLDPKETIEQPFFPSKALRTAAIKPNGRPSGFEQGYRDPKNREKLGAYARFASFPFALVIEQDASAATAAVSKTLIYTSLSASLFVLVAILVSFLGAAGITKNLRSVAVATTKIAGGDFQHRVAVHSSDEVGVLAGKVNAMAEQLANFVQSEVKQAKEKADIEKELQTAKTVQDTFFPERDVTQNAVVATGFYVPATQCGGDLWGHYNIEPGIDFLFIADAMGHGVPAALVTAMAYSVTMTIADIVKHEPKFRDSPSTVLDRLNRVIYDAVKGKISMTFFASILDLHKGVMTFANAGHNFPVILPVDPNDPRSGKPAKSGPNGTPIQPISLKLMGTPLGMDRASVYKEKTIELMPGDKIFYFTDGLIECTSPQGEMLGRKQLLADLTAFAHLPSGQLKDAIKDKAFEFFSTQERADDITILVAEIDKTWKPVPIISPQIDSIAPSPPKPNLMVTEATKQLVSEGSQPPPTFEAPSNGNNSTSSVSAEPARLTDQVAGEALSNSMATKPESAALPKGNSPKYKLKLPSVS